MRRKHHEPLPPEALDEPLARRRRNTCIAARSAVKQCWSMKPSLMCVGAAKFRGEYTGGMPMIGCPGCNSETMVYIPEEHVVRP